MRVALVIALLLVHHAAAEACKHKGKVLYREEQEPLDGYEDRVPNAQLQIYATGAWGRVQEMPDGQEPASQGGCLKKSHLEELVRALAKAKFTSGAPETCDAVPDVALIVSSPKRKKQARMTTPCGETLDATTQALVACAHLAESPESAAVTRAICRGTQR